MADLVAELRRSGESVPSDVVRDLRSARTMIEIFKVDRSRSENLLRIEEYLSNVESYLTPAAGRRFGEDYADQWMKSIVEAQRSVRPTETEPTRRFPIGIRRDKSWVRMEPSREMPVEKIERFAEGEGLEFRTEKDGYLLVYGEKNALKRFVKKTAELLREKGSSSPNKTGNMHQEKGQVPP